MGGSEMISFKHDLASHHTLTYQDFGQALVETPAFLLFLTLPLPLLPRQASLSGTD